MIMAAITFYASKKQSIFLVVGVIISCQKHLLPLKKSSRNQNEILINQKHGNVFFPLEMLLGGGDKNSKEQKTVLIIFQSRQAPIKYKTYQTK
jgi:hypothetical protein